MPAVGASPGEGLRVEQVTPRDVLQWYPRRMDPKQVFQEALELPRSARVALAAELIASLDEEVEAGADALWEQEILKRVEELDSGKVRAVPWSEARRRILVAAGRDPNS